MAAASRRRTVVRLAPVLIVSCAASAWFFRVQDGGPWVAANTLPLAILAGLSWFTLLRGGGYWTGPAQPPDWRMALGVLGFAIPALGLSLYLHYAYSVNLDGMFEQGPGQLFRYLPVYTTGAGGIGFAIGWIVGRNLA